jgi:hypothetical protein
MLQNRHLSFAGIYSFCHKRSSASLQLKPYFRKKIGRKFKLWLNARVDMPERVKTYSREVEPVTHKRSEVICVISDEL